MSGPDFDADAVRGWIADEVEPGDARQLQDLLDAAGDEPVASGAATAGARAPSEALASRIELHQRFSGPLTFGTAGLRGVLRAGPNGMNRAMVRRASAGVVSWLTGRGSAGVELPAIVVVGYDARHGSAIFARDAAGVFAAAGCDARLLPGPLPTPVLAYSVLELHAAVGVMITASHNPKQDNGYKLYGADGMQIVAPVDVQVEQAMRELPSTRSIPLSDDFTTLDDGMVARYVADIAALVAGPASSAQRDPSSAQPRNAHMPTIVHTALHGVGTGVLRRVFAAAGHPEPLSVPAQAEPDPEFPTVAFPNPEEPGALDLAIDLARERSADLVIASDPDADRCAVALDFPGSGWRMLRGDELGVLLADALLARGARGTFATTIVSASMLEAMARDAGVGYGQTLTGFKWIMRAADDLSFGYEEALGYAVAPSLVRDKDGLSAALVIADRAADLAATGSSLVQRLDELIVQYGLFATDQVSVRVDDLGVIAAIMAGVRSAPPAVLLGEPVAVQDLLPDTDAVRLTWRTGRVIIRPSGTEPKLKAYLELVTPAAQITDVAAARSAAAAELSRLRTELSTVLAI